MAIRQQSCSLLLWLAVFGKTALTQTYVTDDNGLVNVDTKQPTQPQNTAGGDWFLLRGNSLLLQWRLRPVFQAGQSYRPIELFRLEKISRLK